MGASRDLSTAYGAGGTTALLERGTETQAPTRETRGPASPSALKPRVAPHVPRGPRRLGSKQVVSVRGRRVMASPDAKRKFSKMSLLAVPLLVLGIFFAMLLSALSTQQTFTIQQLQSQERDLNNQIETLNRDLEDSRAAAAIAAQADQAGMRIPGEPGIIAVDEKGRAHETREANSEATGRVVDVNGETVRTDTATSDRAATRDVADNLSALPQMPQSIGPSAALQAPQQSRQLPPAPAAPRENAQPRVEEGAANPQPEPAPAPANAPLNALPGASNPR